MKKAYIYPILPSTKLSNPNPYIYNFIISFKKDIDFLNKNHPASTGIFNLLKYVTKIDFLFLNWIEDLPDKKAGLFQVVCFILVLNFLKRKKVKIIWTMHNKQSHYTSNRTIKKFLFKYILNNSDYIITHSKEGLRYFSEFKVQPNNKIRYFPHPLESKLIKQAKESNYDILLWGSIIPYKGIDKFLDYLYKNKLENNYKILLAGKVNPENYMHTLLKYCNKSIKLENRYIPEEELKNIISESKTVLFTYEGESVLSSGALMDTLSYGGKVIGPCTGAFKDLEEEELIMTYKEYKDIIIIINDIISSKDTIQEKLNSFVEENNWLAFSNRIFEWIS